MEDKNPALPEANLADMLSSVMGNPELMKKISDAVGAMSSTDQPKETSAAPSVSDALSNPALMEKLPDVMAMLRPMLSAPAQKAPSPPPSDAAHHRIALLCALKPYLSPKRCEAIDYFTRMSKMGDLLKNLKP